MPVPKDPMAAQIDRFLRARRSPLAGHGMAFVKYGRKYGVDPRLLVAISGAETSFATYKPSQAIFNAWGWGPHKRFPSWEAAIDAVAGGLRRGYLDQGLTTIPAISRRYAPPGAGNDPTGLNTNWVKNVTAYYNALGGKGVVGPRADPFRNRSWLRSRYPWLPR